MSVEITNNVACFCQMSTIPAGIGWTESLSLHSALLIAAGYLDSQARAIVVRRAYIYGKSSVNIHSEQLRQCAHEREILLERKGKKKNLLYEHMTNLRLLLVNRKISKIKHQIFDAIGHNDNFLAVRRSRKDGTHLSTERSEKLFEAMLKTPTPNLVPGSIIERIANAAKNPASNAIQSLHLPQSINNKFESGIEYKFVDPYETLLYISGQLYQRIVSSPAGDSDFFSLQFKQINIHNELAQIAADIADLRGIREELNLLEDKELPGFVARKGELNYVWEQLCNRVEALARIAAVLDDVEKKLHELNRVEQSAVLHSKIDELVARQSFHEISVDVNDRVAEQLEDSRKQLEGYRMAISGDISQLLEGRE